MENRENRVIIAQSPWRHEGGTRRHDHRRIRRQVQYLRVLFGDAIARHVRSIGDTDFDRAKPGKPSIPAGNAQLQGLAVGHNLDLLTHPTLTLGHRAKGAFRFLHVSTDEVYGSLGPNGFFTESTPYDPSSPYSASKASSDHLAMAWHRTYGLPLVISKCSNNYGPYQFPEKLVPLVILNELEGKPLPLYGNGSNVRDWLYVEDHAKALHLILSRGRPGETYNVGGRNERTNLEVVQTICRELDEVRPSGAPHERRITYVTDRPGHDHRYAIDASKLARELGWRPDETFSSGIAKTVRWYLDNGCWWGPLRKRVYDGERIGLITNVRET